MSSVSQQHRAHTLQPHCQTAVSKCLPQTKPKERQDNPPNISTKKKRKKKKNATPFLDEYAYIGKMIPHATHGYNWRLLKPKKLGYIILEMWSNPACSNRIYNPAEKSTSERPLLWGFKDP